MRKFILSSLEILSNIAIFLILVSGTIRGAIGGGITGDVGGAIVGGVFGFFMALILCVVLFGVIFLLMEIAENTRRTAAAIESRQSGTDR